MPPSSCRLQESAATAAATLLLLLLVVLPTPTAAVRPFPATSGRYAEAPHFRNGEQCPAPRYRGCATQCNPSHVHIAMTLDARYLRGSVAAVHSLLKHAACPDLIFFHFVATAGDDSTVAAAVLSAFPSLRFKIYPFHASRVAGLISPSVRTALEDPLNYARNYLAALLEPCVRRVIYLDSDILVVDDIRRLWDSPITNSSSVVAAPEYCHANFTRYFTPAFWADHGDVFDGRRRRPCYFNTGVMVMDLGRWRAGRYTRRIEGWMRQQKERRIYELGSLPPFLLVFAGDIDPIDHRWNQHGLGGDNVAGSCRPLHPGPVSLLHWSGKGKPWDRLDAGNPCPIDSLWAPYDLYIPPSSSSTSISSW